MLAVGCTKDKAPEKPQQVVARWLEAMRNLRGDPHSARVAYGLLSKSARANLDDRAKRASAATGQHMASERMLVPFRFRLRFNPDIMDEKIAGNRAIVEVRGEGRVAEVPCVKEQGGWHIDLLIPRLPSVEKRPDAGI